MCEGQCQCSKYEQVNHEDVMKIFSRKKASVEEEHVFNELHINDEYRKMFIHIM